MTPISTAIAATPTSTITDRRAALRVDRRIVSLFDAVTRLLLPRGCAGCDAPDAVLCAHCRSAFLDTQRRSLAQTSMRAGYACGRYDGVVRHAILQWKDHGDEECTGSFALLLEGLVVRTGMLDAWRAHDILIVPVPSSARSIRQRGRWHMLALAKRLAALLRQRGVRAVVAPVLYMERRVDKAVQSLDPAERAERAKGALRCRDVADARGPRAAGAVGRAGTVDRAGEGYAVVLDDIVTTGATMRRCIHLLQGQGLTVLTSLALAYTVLRPAHEE